MSDMGWVENATIKVDSTAAIGAMKKKGVGNMRHIHFKHLWMITITHTFRSMGIYHLILEK